MIKIIKINIIHFSWACFCF